MNKKPIIAIIVSLLILGAAVVIFTTDFNSSNVIDETKEPKDENPTHLGNITSFNDAVNQFCFDFFKKLAEDEDNSPNIFYSPYSVFTALAMTYEGARNNTAAEMENVLSIEQDNESFHEYMQSLHEYLNENSDYNISTANALWVMKNFELLQEYMDIIQTYYGGESSEVDFSKPEEAAAIINQWVENQTNNLIKDLVPASALSDLTRLVLTNAIYFKGTWQVQFDEVNTTDRNFTDIKGNTIKVPTMKLIEKDDKYNYTEIEQFQMLEIPYEGNEISMMIILPQEGYELSDIISSLNRENYDSWIDEMYRTKADIYLPKFKFETSYGLNDYLIELGMIDAFDGNEADFSGIDGKPDLYISQVLHKAFVEVNEEGTEAAAATAVVMTTTSSHEPDVPPERITFDCNHPFLFTIHHKETGTILFMGQVDNPNPSE
jgi:serpin B